jgi:hypothetical protein
MNMKKGLSDAVLFLVIITAVLLIVNHRQSPTYKMALAQDVENNTIAVNNSKNSMLGELIYESSGKLVSQKVVDTGDIYYLSAKVELSYSGSGYMQGIEM